MGFVGHGFVQAGGVDIESKVLIKTRSLAWHLERTLVNKAGRQPNLCLYKESRTRQPLPGALISPGNDWCQSERWACVAGGEAKTSDALAVDKTTG